MAEKIIVKRSASDVCLDVTHTMKLHAVDLYCSHCDKMMVESVVDRCMHTLQQYKLTVTWGGYGCFTNVFLFDLDGDLNI